MTAAVMAAVAAVASLLHSEELADLTTARRTLIPRKREGKTLAPSTLWRWISKGIDGVRLEVVYIGATPHTSREALQRFFDAVTAARLAKMQSSAPELLVATDAQLKAAGLI